MDGLWRFTTAPSTPIEVWGRISPPSLAWQGIWWHLVRRYRSDGRGDGEGRVNMDLVEFTITIPIEIHVTHALISFEPILGR